MKLNHAIVIGISAVLLSGGAALAHGQKGHGDRHMEDHAGEMHDPGDMMQMHGMMMNMRGNMMDGGMMGPWMMRPGMMHGGQMKLGRKLMSHLDADENGRVTPDEAQSQLGKWLDDSDTNGDGTLSIDEFEALHSRLIRETMVDRFQYLDADGDGQVTREEMTAPARKMERMQNMRDLRMWDDDDMQDGGMHDSQMNMHGQEKSDNDFIAAYNYARRLKTLQGLTPFEYICKIWTNEPDRFNVDPTHHTLGLNT